MAKKLYEEADIQDIADAIREQNGAATKYKVSKMGDAVRGISKAEKPIYSFGLLADLHIQYATGLDNPLTSDSTDDGDFRRALLYLRDKVPFTCIAGDLLSYATEEFYLEYKNCIDSHKGSMSIYECGGNHETYPAQGVSGTLDTALWRTYTGKDPYYSFEYQGDVFVLVSAKNANPSELFLDGAFEWLENTLEANKNKRCFVFWHYPAAGDKTADFYQVYSNSMTGPAGANFVELMSHYKNAIHIHGHTHLSLSDEHPPVANEFAMGYRSIHVPSMVAPRFYDRESNTVRDYYYDEGGNKIWGSSHSEGYIVDVYADKIVLRGIDFASGANCDEVVEMDEEHTLDTPMYLIPTVTGIEATFTQGDEVITPATGLDSLKSMLVVKTIDELGKIIISDYTLSGTLEVGTSTITVTYGEFAATFDVTVTAEEAGAKNWLAYSQNADGTRYYGTNGEAGYKKGYKLSSSGSESTKAETDITGFIPVSVGDVLRFYNFSLDGMSSDYTHKIQFYTTGHTSIGYALATSGNFTADWGAVFDGTELKQITVTSNAGSGKALDLSNVGYIRVCGGDMTADSWITVNEELPTE